MNGDDKARWSAFFFFWGAGTGKEVRQRVRDQTRMTRMQK
jgi:hypothetical protein